MTPRLYFLLNTAQRALQRQVDGALPGRLTAAQAGVLFLLGAKEGVPIGEVARGLGATASSVTELIDRMVAAGLIERQADPADGRLQLLTLTGAGQDGRLIALAGLDELNVRMTQGFTADELATVSRWLDTIRERCSGLQGQSPWVPGPHLRPGRSAKHV